MSTNRKAAAISPLMRELSGYISKALHKPLPADVSEKARHHTLDTIAAMVSGSRLLPGRMAISYAKTLGGKREASVVGSRLVTSAVHAALANAMCAHADETDDSHAPSLTHPGCGIIAAALAIAERMGASGEALLRAVALGYDVSSRLTMSLGGADFRQTGHLTHSFGPTFGAAAAAAALLKLGADQVRHVLSYTAQQVSGISTYPRDTEHIEKAFDFGGMAARNGVTAASMVAAGCTAVEDVFSGERNFFVAYDESRRNGRPPPQPQILVRDLGSYYEILRTNIKRWSVGSPIQAPLDSLYSLIRSHGVKADEVEKITVRVSTTGADTTDDRDMPDICMQHMCAVMLLDGIVTFESAHDEKRMKHPGVRAVRRRVELVRDEELQKLIPERHGIVELALTDGRQLRHHTQAVRGTAQNPMPRAEVDEKCYHLMTPILGPKKARALCDAVWSLSSLKDVRRLRPLLKA